MRYRMLTLFTVSVVLAAAAFGMGKRSTYTDFTADENYLEQLMVAEFPEKLVEQACDAMRETLPEAPVVLRVTVTGELEHCFGIDRQKVRIQKIYAEMEGHGGLPGAGGALQEKEVSLPGESRLQEGQEIYLSSRSWRLPISNEMATLERGFVNILDVGSEYLVFAGGIVDDLEGEIPVVMLLEDTLIAPVFCCEERENIAVPVREENTYVPYREVSENEFFGETQETIAVWAELKEEILGAYGIKVSG